MAESDRVTEPDLATGRHRVADHDGVSDPDGVADHNGVADHDGVAEHDRLSTAARPDTTPQQAVADPREIARRSAAAMLGDDKASAAAGIELVGVAPGRATVAMTVRADMVNGHDIAHGGYVFLLADTAFAVACNSYGQRTVAAGCDIAFVAPAYTGDRLTAEAVERHRAGRSGIYDVAVRRDDGTVVAELRGRSRTISGTLIPMDGDPS